MHIKNHKHNSHNQNILDHNNFIMSTAPESSPSFPVTSDVTRNNIRDIFLWKRKKQSLMVLIVATTAWTLLDVYQFNLITVISWLTMAVVASAFLWGNTYRLLAKEAPSMSGLYVSEQSATDTANSVREWMEEGIRWMFRVSAEREWFVFAATVAGLWLLSLVGSYLDLLTLVYTGIVMGMTVPVLYMNYGENIRRYEDQVKVHARKFYDMVDERVHNLKISKLNAVKQDKEKKVE